MRRNICAFILFVCVLLTGCGKDDYEPSMTMKEAMMFEHTTLSSLAVDGEEVIIPCDTEGFYPCNDKVYVTSDTLNLRVSPNAESEIVTTVTYGTSLSRTGDGTKGWDRILYEDQVAYVNREYLTTLEILEERTFDFSQAMLSIVDTSRQIYSYDSMCEDLAELKEQYGQHMALNVIGTTTDDRNIFEVVIGSAKAKKNITFVGATCGTEYMTALVCMKQLEYYLCYYETGNYQGYRYSDLFDNVAIHVIPMLNPDSVTISQEYLTCVKDASIQENLKDWFERDQTKGGTSLSLENYLMFFYANANGVDIRKNFNYHWEDATTAVAAGSTGYKGTSADTEAETRAILHMLTKGNNEVVVSYHTTGSKIMYNYGQSSEVLTLAKTYSEALSGFMNYESVDTVVKEDGYGSLEGYSNVVAGTPTLFCCLGNGSAPLSLNEFSAIWNACRESWAAMQVEVIDY